MKRLALSSVGIFAALSVHAQSVGIGVLHIAPRTSSNGIVATNPLAAAVLPAGAGASVGNADTLMFSYEQHLNDNLGLELVIAIPPKHDLIGKGTLKPGQKIGSLKQLSPVLLLNYHFGTAGDTWRPSVGAGLVYAKLGSIQIDPSAMPGTTASANTAFGLALQASMAYRFDDQWSLVSAVGYTQAKNRINLSTTTPFGVATSKMDATTRNTTLSMALHYDF